MQLSLKIKQHARLHFKNHKNLWTDDTKFVTKQHIFHHLLCNIISKTNSKLENAENITIYCTTLCWKIQYSKCEWTVK